MSRPICDYSDFDYEAEYWQKTDRRYEDLCDKKTLFNLLKKLPKKPFFVLDAGCGYGRLLETYQTFGHVFFLMDYALPLLKQAQEKLPPLFNQRIELVNGNLYDLPFASSVLDLVISVRTLHHIQDPNTFFKEVNRLLKLHGHFILEIPNKRHLLQLLRFFIGKAKENPFSKKPFAHSETFINYHPHYILKLLKRNGFLPIQTLNTSFFRMDFLKKKFSPTALSNTDQIFQALFSFLNISPSIYVLCEKRGIVSPA